MGIELIRKLPYDHPYRWDGSLFGGPKLWQPSDITTSAWYDAYREDTVLESGGAVYQWNDRSGNGQNLVQATGSKQPTSGTRSINGLNTLDFSNDVLSGALTNSIDDCSVIAVFQPDGVAASYIYANAGLGGSKSRNYLLENGIDFGNASLSFTGSTDAKIVFGYVTDTGDGSTQGYRINGGDATTGSVDRGVTNQAIHIGDYNDIGGTSPYNGIIGEVLVFNSVLGDSDRQKIEGYLAHKWGLEANLPALHPYKGFPPITNSGNFPMTLPFTLD
jgi:hypothetical protein